MEEVFRLVAVRPPEAIANGEPVRIALKEDGNTDSAELDLGDLESKLIEVKNAIEKDKNDYIDLDKSVAKTNRDKKVMLL